MNKRHHTKYHIIFIILKLITVILMISLGFQGCKEEEGIYYCPMHPEYTATRPGDCPICGMKLLIKKSTSESHSNHNHKDSPNKNLNSNINEEQDISNHNTQRFRTPGDFRVSIDKQKSIGVKTTFVESKEMESTILSSGQVVYDPELYTALVEYREALRLGSSGDVGFTQQAKNKLLRIGFQEEDIRKWSRMNPDILLTGRNGKNAYVFTQVFERDLRHLRIGKSVSIAANSQPGESFKGKILGWSKLLDEKNRSTQAWIEVYDPLSKLSPRMFTETKIHIPLGKVLLVPRNAVIHTGLKDLVYTKIDQDRFRPALVTVGEENQNSVQILSGLEEGDEVVVGANFLLDSEARMQLGGEL